MSYENIEAPTPEVDRLYREIVADYKTGKYKSQEEALSILEAQYFFSSIDIKEELSREFDAHPFYVYGEMGNLDEYINICDKSINGPTSTEKEIYAQLLDRLIRKVHERAVATKPSEPAKVPRPDEPPKPANDLWHINNYEDAAKCVYRQVERVRNLCRQNMETKGLYEKYKAEIEAMPETAQQQIAVQSALQKAQAEIDKTLSILLSENHIKKYTAKTGVEYRITTTVPMMQTILKMKKENGEIALPEIKDIDDFMIKYLRSKKKGNSLYDAIRVNKNR